MAPAEEHSHHATQLQNRILTPGFVHPQPWHNSPHCSKVSPWGGCPIALSAEHPECCQPMDHHGTRAGVTNLPIFCLPEVFRLPSLSRGVVLSLPGPRHGQVFGTRDIPSASPNPQLHQTLSTLHKGGMPNKAGSATGILPNPWDGRLPPLRAIQLPVSTTTASNELPNLAPLLHPGFKI